MELPRSFAALSLAIITSASPVLAATADHAASTCNPEETCCCIEGKYKGQCAQESQKIGAKCESHQQHTRAVKKADSTHSTAKHESHEKLNKHT